jgi:hypothetical protein
LLRFIAALTGIPNFFFGWCECLWVKPLVKRTKLGWIAIFLRKYLFARRIKVDRIRPVIPHFILSFRR